MKTKTIYSESGLCSAKTWHKLNEDQKNSVRKGCAEALARTIALRLLSDGLIKVIEGEDEGNPSMRLVLTIVTEDEKDNV